MFRCNKIFAKENSPLRFREENSLVYCMNTSMGRKCCFIIYMHVVNLTHSGLRVNV